MDGSRRNFLDHLHSPAVTLRALHPKTTLGLGIAALTCFTVLLATGFTLFLYYVPEQEKAYERILHISTTLGYGRLVRNLHYVSANALLVLAWLHLSRVVFTGAYQGRRRNWLYGLALLVLVLAANFTGYLLPWNQISYWAIKVGATLAGYFPVLGDGLKRFLLGGEGIGPETLLRSFALHAGVMPVSILVFAALHLWRIRKDGGLAAAATATEKVPADPWLYRAEGAAALLTLTFLLLSALLLEAPIYERADPSHPPNPAKAPWYFVGIQEMVSHSALAGGVVIPALFGLFLVLAPFLDRSRSPGGTWFARDRLWVNLVYLAFLLSQVAFIVVGQWFRSRNWEFRLPF